MRKVAKDEECEAMNQDLIKIHDWSLKWNMEFNKKKCNVMEFGESARRNEKINKRT